MPLWPAAISNVREPSATVRVRLWRCRTVLKRSVPAHEPAPSPHATSTASRPSSDQFASSRPARRPMRCGAAGVVFGCGCGCGCVVCGLTTTIDAGAGLAVDAVLTGVEAGRITGGGGVGGRGGVAGSGGGEDHGGGGRGRRGGVVAAVVDADDRARRRRRGRRAGIARVAGAGVVAAGAGVAPAATTRASMGPRVAGA